MKMIKQQGAAGLLDYVFAMSVIIGASITAATALETKLDTELARLVGVFETELQAIKAATASNDNTTVMDIV